MSIDKGMFNFQGIMDKFYGYNPGEEDSEGRAIKNSFMANMIQSGFDSQMAKDMSQMQSSIAQSNMTLAADLEARNTASNMQQEFNYGMQSMGGQFEYQNKFANNQYNRDLGTLAAQGDQYRKGLETQGSQERLNTVVKGEQEQKNTLIVADASKYGAAAAADASKFGSAQSADATKYSAAVSGDSAKYVANQQSEASKYGSDNSLEGTKYTADSNVRGITETGEQTRETMTLEDNLQAKKADRQTARSKSLARSF